MINLQKKHFNLIKQHALSVNPEECCGLLINKNKILIVLTCRNESEDKLNNFSINTMDYFNGSKIGEVVGFYHSHCLSSQPNDFTSLDKLNSISHGIPLVLYYLPNDEFKIFEEKDILSSYIGKKFEYNKQDCLSLVEEFYCKEYKIKLPHFPRNENWIRNQPESILENFEKFGFKKIIDDNINIGDVILISNDNNNLPSHLMIYLGNNQILHHRFQGYSTVEQYSYLYKVNTHSIVRHNSLWN